MSGTRKLIRGATEYVTVRLTVATGVVIDGTLVQIAIVKAGAVPTWRTTSVVSSAPGTVTVRTLVNMTLTPLLGVYDVLVRLNGTPEVVVVEAGTLSAS